MADATGRTDRRRPGAASLWLWALVGWSLGRLVCERRPVPLPPDAAFWEARARLPAAPAEWNARELRTLPGVGEARALAIVRAREAAQEGRAAPPRRWEDVSGIGERTARAVRAAFAARGMSADGPLAGSAEAP